MIKLTTSDILAVLRGFKVANEAHRPRDIEQRAVFHLSPHSILISFRFNKHRYYILSDTQNKDTVSSILQQINIPFPNIQTEIIKKPDAHYIADPLIFKGKPIYLAKAISNKQRLDLKLANEHPDISRSTWQKHIKAGRVKVNETVQNSIKHEVNDTDKITTILPSESDFSDQNLPIVYLDENIIVINKPIGVLTHSKGTLNDEFTVADFFRRYTTDGLETNRPGIVHRLDRDTSGVLIGARNAAVATFLKKQFAQHRTKKTYIAILDGQLKHKEATIELPIARNPAQPSTFKVDGQGKPAITHYKVLATTPSQTLIILQPITGRTHQLRVHMSYLDAPIAGDKTYGKAADRLYLHAHQLELTLPGGKREIFTAPIPKTFTSHFPGVTL